MNLEPVVRRARENDLAAVAEIQAASPEASQWEVREYLQYDFSVALCGDKIAGFAVAHLVAPGEAELLNLAVDPAFRRRGLGRRLLRELLSRHPGDLWLEVRESNIAARNFYKKMGLSECGRRPDYYRNTNEAAIVMNIHS